MTILLPHNWIWKPFLYPALQPFLFFKNQASILHPYSQFQTSTPKSSKSGIQLRLPSHLLQNVRYRAPYPVTLILKYSAWCCVMELFIRISSILMFTIFVEFFWGTDLPTSKEVAEIHPYLDSSQGSSDIADKTSHWCSKSNSSKDNFHYVVTYKTNIFCFTYPATCYYDSLRFLLYFYA